MVKMLIVPLVLEAGGTLLALYTLHEVFRDIFHPTRSGSLSDLIGWLVSRLTRHTRLRPSVGPIALVTVSLCWFLLLAAGFGFLYCGLTMRGLIGFSGHPEGFPGSLLRSMYLSLGTLDTFQTFDAEIRRSWLRAIISFEGLLGISMITASVSWLVLLYPALARTRFFARRISILVQAERRIGGSLVRDLGTPILTELMQGIVQLRLDFILFPILLNFYPSDPAATIACSLLEVCRIAREGIEAELPLSVRFAGAQLQIALEELSRELCERVVNVDQSDMDAVFRAFKEREG